MVESVPVSKWADFEMFFDKMAAIRHKISIPKISLLPNVLMSLAAIYYKIVTPCFDF